MSNVPTALRVSPDSGVHWTEPGAWAVSPGVYRIPLPLPMDGLRAVNVYAIETPGGLTLIDGGWAIQEGRDALEAGLKQIGYGFGDIRQFLVTHVHRDHYTLASLLGRELGATVTVGIGEKPTMDVLASKREDSVFAAQLTAAGARTFLEAWSVVPEHRPQELGEWSYPDAWIEDDRSFTVGDRTIDAVSTPGHTQGHVVFADKAAGVLFAGDHVLPTITPSIGFEPAPAEQPLGDFMASLTKVRSLPDLQLLPAHGPVWMSSHERVDQLLEHHEHRLQEALDSLEEGPKTAFQVAHDVPWTRHAHHFTKLDEFDGAMAAMETKAHLELLVARGQATREVTADGVVFTRI